MLKSYFFNLESIFQDKDYFYFNLESPGVCRLPGGPIGLGGGGTYFGIPISNLLRCFMVVAANVLIFGVYEAFLH